MNENEHPNPLAAAVRIGGDAARQGFDWPDVEGPLLKVEEEAAEVREALTQTPERVAEEIGDLLFAVANVARKAGVDPNLALGNANQKFIARFEQVARAVEHSGRRTEDVDLDELESLWQAAKAHE